MAGSRAEALDLLKEAARNHHDFLLFRPNTDPEFDNLRADRRFQRLLEIVYASR
jgi:hypothetical protein